MEEINTNQPQQSGDVEMIEVNTPSFFNRHFLHILVVFGIGYLLFTFLFQIYFRPIYVVGQSMQPTINLESTSPTDLDHKDLVYYKVTNNYSKGDIIIADIAEYLTGQKDSVIKRVVATAGDTLTFVCNKIELSYYSVKDNLNIYRCEYSILLNGELLIEDYTNNEQFYFSFVANRITGEYADSTDYDFMKLLYENLLTEGDKYSITITDNQYFIMGDNRNHSTDSKYFGPINKEDIKGEVAIHIPYGTNFFVGIWKEIWG